jgi:hypothetical protein
METTLENIGEATVAGATLNATVIPNGLSTTLHFDYGTTTSYGSTSTFGDVGSGISGLGIGLPISGLSTSRWWFGGETPGSSRSRTLHIYSVDPPVVGSVV